MRINITTCSFRSPVGNRSVFLILNLWRNRTWKSFIPFFIIYNLFDIFSFTVLFLLSDFFIYQFLRSWLLSLTPLFDSSPWLISLTPLFDSSLWLLSLAPLFVSYPWLLSLTPLLDSSPWLLSLTTHHRHYRLMSVKYDSAASSHQCFIAAIFYSLFLTDED